MRWLGAILPIVAGCQLVFPLEAPSSHDEDGDRIADQDDRCPHIRAASQDDLDNDGIANPCDPDFGPSDAYFFPFVDGAYDETLLMSIGTTRVFEDALGIGVETDAPTWVLTEPIVGPSRIEVEIGFEIAEPPPDTASYHEVGVVTQFRDVDNANRGRICFAGYDAARIGYLDAVNDETLLVQKTASGSLYDTPSVLRMQFTPTNLACEVVIDASTETSLDVVEDEPVSDLGGRIGVMADQSRARIRYLWIYIHRPAVGGQAIRP